MAEKKAFELLRRLLQKQDLKKEAAALINAWWRIVKIKKLQKANEDELMNTQVKSQMKALGLLKLQTKTFLAVQVFVDEIFQKRLEMFKKERQRVQRKGIPLSENLQKINQLIENHLNELNNALRTFNVMRERIDKFI